MTNKTFQFICGRLATLKDSWFQNNLIYKKGFQAKNVTFFLCLYRKSSLLRSKLTVRSQLQALYKTKKLIFSDFFQIIIGLR